MTTRLRTLLDALSLMPDARSAGGESIAILTVGRLGSEHTYKSVSPGSMMQAVLEMVDVETTKPQRVGGESSLLSWRGRQSALVRARRSQQLMDIRKWALRDVYRRIEREHAEFGKVPKAIGVYFPIRGERYEWVAQDEVRDTMRLDPDFRISFG